MQTMTDTTKGIFPTVNTHTDRAIIFTKPTRINSWSAGCHLRFGVVLEQDTGHVAWRREAIHHATGELLDARAISPRAMLEHFARENEPSMFGDVIGATKQAIADGRRAGLNVDELTSELAAAEQFARKFARR